LVGNNLKNLSQGENLENFSTPFLEKTREFVGGFIAENFTEKICYHNIDHTLDVVIAAELIGRKCNLSDYDLETVLIAAWFHDTAYYLGCQNHEQASAQIANGFLLSENVDKDRIKQITDCILSTKIPQKPKTILAKVLCDADLFHLATDRFFEKSELLWIEFTKHNQRMTPEFWLNQTKEFVEAHKYHTQFGKEILFPRLQKNLALLKSKIKEYQY